MNTSNKSKGHVMLTAVLVLLVVGVLATSPFGAVAADNTGAAQRPAAGGEVLCPGAWSIATNLPIPLAYQAVTRQGSYIYSFAGKSNGVLVANAYKFNGNTWTPIAPLPVAVWAASAVSDGRYIYVVNGADSEATRNTLYRYDPVTNSYTRLAPAPHATLGQSVAYLAGKIYRIGGNTTTGSWEPTNAVDVYNIATGTWSAAANYPTTVGFNSSIGRGGYVYSASGEDYILTPLVKTYRYDPVANIWDDAAFADLPQGYAQVDAVSDIVGGQWVLVGNRPTRNVTATDLSSTWTFLPDTPVYVSGAGGATLNNVLHVLGGTGMNNHRTDLRYQPCTPSPTSTNS